MSLTATPTAPAGASGWQRFAATSVRAFHAYAGWLVSISWWKFAALSILLLILASVLQSMPPFRWTISETISGDETPSVPSVPPVPPVPKPPKAGELPAPPRAPMAPSAPAAASTAGSQPSRQVIRIDKRGDPSKGVEISIDERGIRITPHGKAVPATPGAASAAASAAAEAVPDDTDSAVEIKLPPGVTNEGVKEAVAEARRAIAEAVRDARDEARQAQEEARQATEEARQAAEDAGIHIVHGGARKRIREVRWGEFLPDLAFFWIIASMALKATYKGRLQAEAQAQQAVETAESESLKRQVVEARMAAMQAQVEPHFLFNTLASIDHLIETDPQRASQMQKNLIALLRASMPTLRETGGNGGSGGVRDLGRELAMIRPYLEILKVRMEERLHTDIQVPDGLMSAEFPPMMMQTLVENAIKHGLEPKPEGGTLKIAAEVRHGKLAVTVADTGLGFGKAATAGTGVGLANIRERLQLLYGPKATLTIAETLGGGTTVTVTLPYKPVEEASA